jgi:hypothetical protein
MILLTGLPQAHPRDKVSSVPALPSRERRKREERTLRRLASRLHVASGQVPEDFGQKKWIAQKVTKNAKMGLGQRSEWHEDKGFLGWFFVPEGHMTVARRFIAGSGST